MGDASSLDRQTAGKSPRRAPASSAASKPETGHAASAMPQLRNSASAPCLADAPSTSRRTPKGPSAYSGSSYPHLATADTSSMPPLSISSAARPVLVILHGLTGGSQETYVQHCVAEAAEHGMTAVVMIARGCGGLALTSPLCFSAALTEDVKVAVRRVRQRVGMDTPLFAIGFSLGASILAKYLCEEGANAPFVAAASCAASFDPRLSCSALEENSLYRMTYNRSMAGSLKAFYLRHQE